MPPPVENTAAHWHAQPQDLQLGNYDMALDMANDNYLPPLAQGHRDHFIGDIARIVQDVPAQAPFAPPAPVPVCTDLTLPHTHI